MLLNDDVVSAKNIFKQIDSPRAKWGISLIEILTGYLVTYPSYFGIRNFLEIDLEFLIKNNKISYVEQFLGAAELLSNINSETYKYLARVMMLNDLYKVAEKYLILAKNTLYKDPELHYLLTSYYLHNKNYIEAKYSISECLRILPDYYPALELSSKISAIINSIDEN